MHSHKKRADWKTLDDLEPQLAEFEYRVQMGDYDTAAKLLTEFDSDCLLLWGHYGRMIAMHERLQGRIRNATLATFSVGNLGTAYHSIGRVSRAIGCYETALESARRDENRQAEGVCLGNLGNVYRDLGQIDKAIDYYQQALTIARDIEDRSGEGTWLGNLGNAYHDLGQNEKAIDYYQQALTIDREIGDRNGEGADLGNLGNAFHNLGQNEKAIDYYQQALTIKREIGDRNGECIHMGNLAGAQMAAGEYIDAIQNSRESLRIAQEIRSPREQSHSGTYLALALLLSGNLPGAEDTIVAARAFDVPENNHNCAALHGIILTRLGKREGARLAFEDSIRGATEMLDRTPRLYKAQYAQGLAQAGLTLCVGADPQRAIETNSKALSICTAKGVVEEQLLLLDALMACPGSEALASVRRALSGER